MEERILQVETLGLSEGTVEDVLHGIAREFLDRAGLA